MLRKVLVAMTMTGALLQGAMAAPFCLSIPGGGDQCVYYDGSACARDASRATGGYCSANPQEVSLPPSSTSFGYCVVTPTGGQTCGYADPNTCSHEASLQHGACLKAYAAPQQLPNEYAPDANR